MVVQFTPPQGTSPGEVGTLIDASADDVDVSAMLIDLAVRGHLTITETSIKKRWRFDRLTSNDPLTEAEAHLLGSLFRSGSSVRSEKIDAQTYAGVFAGTKKLLNNRVTGELGWFNTRPATAQAQAIGAGIGLVFAGLGLGAVLAFTAGLGLVGLAPIILGVVVMAMSTRFSGRTPQGSAVLSQARGFEQYLTTAEADQIKFEEGIDVFSKYLPYAMVFGVAERWTRVFQQLAAEGRYQPDTSWYVGPYIYSPGFAESIGSLGSDLGATFAESAAPSGGSGGSSGFSGGGGFGGGGGGGW